jgi:hypothetical protein
VGSPKETDVLFPAVSNRPDFLGLGSVSRHFQLMPPLTARDRIPDKKINCKIDAVIFTPDEIVRLWSSNVLLLHESGRNIDIYSLLVNSGF